MYGEHVERTTYMRVFVRAAKIAGDDEVLAVMLVVSRLELRKWSSGEETPFERAFLAAVDLITQESRLRSARHTVEGERSRRRARGAHLRIVT